MKRLLSRIPRPTLVAILLIPILFLTDTLCYQITLPVEIEAQRGSITLTVGSTRLALGKHADLQSLQFAPHNPLIHEYQIDGSDSTNNLDLDTGYLSQVAASPYYRLQSWMRDLAGTSRWRDLEIQANGREIKHMAWPANGAQVPLPGAAHVQIYVQLQRPETPMSLNLALSDGNALQITLDRNNRQITVSDPTSLQTVAHAFFPLDVAPFAAMVIDTLARILLWAALLLLAVQLCELCCGWLLNLLWKRRTPPRDLTLIQENCTSDEQVGHEDYSIGVETGRMRASMPNTSGTPSRASARDRAGARAAPTMDEALGNIGHFLSQAASLVRVAREKQKEGAFLHRIIRFTRKPMDDQQSSYHSRGGPHARSDRRVLHARHARPITRAHPTLSTISSLFHPLHPVALLALAGSFAYVLWIALVEYQGQPHIYDTSTYVFMAKIYASGQFSVPAPAASKLFPGPFMVIFNGRWFGQYDPGTALTLVPGFWLHAPWLVEPVLGTLALLGIGLIAARLYDRRVATLAVLLGCLSPFYSYLAASYLSHAITLFYLVWGMWALLRFAQGGAGWNMLICGLCFGMAALTRDLVALLYILILVPGVVIVAWKPGKGEQWVRLKWWLIFLLISMVFFYLYAGFNQLLTGDPLATPRALFFPGDTWGFGRGIGFYGQHTLAAGFVNLDELLTSLQIDLFGWPFYFTLAFVVMPFLTLRATKTDWFLLIALLLTAGSYIGYFYHGIYLGPRYWFEDLLFLLLLSARGILALGAWGVENGRATVNWLRRRTGQARGAFKPALSIVTLVLVGALLLCNLIYYLPRQAARYQNYTGVASITPLDTSQIYHSPVHHALVITDDLAIYQIVLFSLNDPNLRGDVIYAWGYTSQQYAQLRKAFPGRALYLLVINPDGSVRYIPFNP